MLTEREKWLMQQAFAAGLNKYASYPFGEQDGAHHFNNWLDQDAADAVSIEMVLAKNAPTENKDRESALTFER